MFDADMLIAAERKFAPTLVTAPRVVSPFDTPTHPTNRGADKFDKLGNNYGKAYAEILDGITPDVLIELGVLTGVSLAVWCELYPDCQVIGLDVDLERMDWDGLVSNGAFKLNRPSVFVWDAFDPQPLPTPVRVDVFIDDGPHRVEAIRRTAQFMKPLMNDGGRYVVEDVPEAAQVLRDIWPDHEVKQWGRLSAVFL